MDKRNFTKGVAANAKHFMERISDLKGKEVIAYTEAYNILVKLESGVLTIIETELLDELESRPKPRNKAS